MVLDAVDEAIIRLLQEDGRRPVSEMARVVGVAEQTVRNRIERMTSNSVFDVMAILNPTAVGLEKDVLINLRVRPDRLLAIGDALAAIDNVSYVGFLTGSYDIMIEVFLSDDAELFRFITTDLYGIDGIQQAETWTVLHTKKWAHGWASPFPESGFRRHGPAESYYAEELSEAESAHIVP
jgi:Lrp/AsnC family transcriptional regulator for asnA, asnC and gidA